MNSNKKSYMQLYFEQLECQRNEFYYQIVKRVENPWKRPLPDKWSVGETIFHLYLMIRLVKRFSVIYLPIVLPYAHLRKERPYKTEIHNIYEEYSKTKKRPMKAPFVLTPRDKLSTKYDFKNVQHLLNMETNKLKEKLANMEDHVAGQIRYPDPVANYPNIIQSIQLLAIHEQHHFDLTKRYYR
ncbi:DinB family protein [Ornithinibacillus sp. L9]|uniref:DinB family protein n=1 Tax=Ornithinibacillus caprae TaxID=2678566 RepID=A0A6N8FEF9_9BACI|nr:DinB family protein [Ornithinibacillus caprae]MUK87903.1 DinB family protein [Ornithinibacillus caprae]